MGANGPLFSSPDAPVDSARTSVEQLAEGVYWLEVEYALGEEDNRFGRFAGFTSGSSEKARARRHKHGCAHFEWEADVLETAQQPLSYYSFREDGTQTCYINFNDSSYKLWRFTHYVNLPAEALVTLGTRAADVVGLTADQERWIAGERTLRWENHTSEYSAQLLMLTDEVLADLARIEALAPAAFAGYCQEWYYRQPLPGPNRLPTPAA